MDSLRAQYEQYVYDETHEPRWPSPEGTERRDRRYAFERRVLETVMLGDLAPERAVYNIDDFMVSGLELDVTGNLHVHINYSDGGDVPQTAVIPRGLMKSRDSAKGARILKMRSTIEATKSAVSTAEFAIVQAQARLAHLQQALQEQRLSLDCAIKELA